ncbi:MAG TPA: hypothetical protein VMV46_20370 [Thermoanaerobaculia bacterium]|nr:hypothetical protein [Thermoanaerobaculia bacterium]
MKGLGERLREASGEELQALIEERASELRVEDALQALRNPWVSREVVALLLAQRRLLGAYTLRRELAAHRLTPEAAAVTLLAGLFWRDLSEIQRQVRVAPRIRRAAESQLVARLPGLSLGEKIALARRATGAVVGALGSERSGRVISAVLENPRCTEGLVVRLVRSPRTAPEVLETVARDQRWARLLEVRRGLGLNPRSPVAVVLGLLPTLRKSDLRAITRNVALAAPVRRRAALLLGEEPPGPSRR